MKNIVVFASGSGSNFEAIANACINGLINGVISLLIVNKKNAFAIERAKKLGIEYLVVERGNFETKKEYEKEILKHLKIKNPDLIALAGYMMILEETILDEYEGKIINIHPSLLPAFPGKDSFKKAIEYGCKVVGATVHYVDSGMDTGKIIAQESFGVEDYEYEELENKLHKIEHELYIKAINKVLED